MSKILINISGPIRPYSADERSILLSEVDIGSSLGYEIAEKLRRFCSYHRSNLLLISEQRFGLASNQMLIWMYEILELATKKIPKAPGYSFDPAFVNALLHLVDAVEELQDKGPSLEAMVRQLFSEITSFEATSIGMEINRPFNIEHWSDEAKSVGRVIIFCPNPFSLYTSMILHLCLIFGIEVSGVVVRRFTVHRFISELRRDGFTRLLKKIMRKLIIRGDENAEDSKESLKKLHDELIGSSPNIYSLCKENEIELMKVKEFEDCSNWMGRISPDLGFFTGGGMVSSGILDVFSVGVLNMHMGVLPKYKGMDVVQAAVLENENVGMTAHIMAPKLDAGPVVNTLSLSPLGYPSLGYLRNSMSAYGPLLAFDSMLGLFAGRLRKIEQPISGRQYYVMHPLLIDLTNNVLKAQSLKLGSLKNHLSKILTKVINKVKTTRLE